MTKSARIRELAGKGLTVRQIADEVGIRYQHAYNVLKASGLNGQPMKRTADSGQQVAVKPMKPILAIGTLIAGGFALVSRWVLSDTDELKLELPIENSVGVYAFAISGVVQYIGVATMGLSRRLYFYGRPGSSQKTSLRLNATIRALLLEGKEIEILVATPSDLEWNGLPVHGAAGLELGLIKKFDSPWNMRSSG